jgi:HAD superfamily hydrolase (TIGR01509 family)
MTAAANSLRDVPSSPLQLVIFDCDGVLVDSEPISHRIFAGMVSELGLAISAEQVWDRFLGKSMAQSLALVSEQLGRALPAEFAELYQARVRAAFVSELRPIPGIEAALAAIDLPYCVASSGTHEKMQVSLAVTGLLPKFRGRIFSVADVAHAKPAPDVYLHAAATLGVPAQACAVIEDSPTGVQAGVAAGMRVYGYAAHTPAQRLTDAGAYRTFSDMSDLSILLQRI